MEPQGPHIIAARAPERVDKLQKWRRRYPNKEYPSKVAINIILEALVREEEHSHYQRSFGQSKVQDLDEAVKQVRKKEEDIRDRVLQKAELAFKDRKRIGNLEVKGLRDKVSDAQQQDNSAVEDLEFSYVYYGLVYELFTGWYAAGICGLDRKEAMMAMTGRAVENPRDTEAVEGLFGNYASAVMDQIGAYDQLPALWPDPW